MLWIRNGQGPVKVRTQIYEPVRVLELGVLGFEAILDLTSATFLGAAGTR